jgi:NAD(P)-dependent dehydrogenase (short-subunit alcohol dehydrogenase family)
MTTKVALVTGASSGIGEATAKQLREAGYTVYAAARRVERMRHLTKSGIRPLAMDVTAEEPMRAGIDRILAEEGRIDVLVNNAGYGSYGAVEDVPMEEARRQFEVNVFGAARLTQLVLPHMRQQHSGTIVNITSMGGKISTPLGAWYHATKFALEAISDCLRMEVKPFGITSVWRSSRSASTSWSSNPGVSRPSGPPSPPTTSAPSPAAAPTPRRATPWPSRSPPSSPRVARRHPN